MTVTRMIIGVGCHRKAEAAFRFLHGVSRVDVGQVAWAPLDAHPDIQWTDPPELWRVQVIRLAVDLDIFPLDIMVDVMEVLVEEQEQSTAQPLCHRKVWMVSDPASRHALEAILDRRGHTIWRSWLFEQAAFLRAPDDLQDSYVRWPEAEYSEAVILPCLRRLAARVPQQFDLET